jgi:ABC-type transport system involved in cytochrome c biogenesis permease subunit
MQSLSFFLRFTLVGIFFISHLLAMPYQEEVGARSEAHFFLRIEELFKDVPVAYQGRFRPFEVCARLWCKEQGDATELEYPLYHCLMQVDTGLSMLPSYQGQGEWLPLKALASKEAVSNFTLFPEDHFRVIQESYLKLREIVKMGREPFNTEEAIVQAQILSTTLKKAYIKLAETPYLSSGDRVLKYPSTGQLKAEIWYYRIPFVLIITVLYFLAFLILWISHLFSARKIGVAALCVLSCGFFVQTLLLALRCYILERPPVSNMYETALYVPWVALLTGMALYFYVRATPLLMAAVFTSISLLTTLQLSGLPNTLDNVQAVLDSQYWLIIHVLLVVGSYGAFAFASVLGHVFLISNFLGKSPGLQRGVLGHAILQMLYFGVSLLIPGTLLGGIWAAQSWGRFWDWDPKESWAFISICLYLMCIHAFRKRQIDHFGLAMGAVIGFLAISFTWYGVNYILGTGLHSYGFGSGGELYYLIFFVVEILFLLYLIVAHSLFDRVNLRNTR